MLCLENQVLKIMKHLELKNLENHKSAENDLVSEKVVECSAEWLEFS